MRELLNNGQLVTLTIGPVGRVDRGVKQNWRQRLLVTNFIGRVSLLISLPNLSGSLYSNCTGSIIAIDQHDL